MAPSIEVMSRMSSSSTLHPPDHPERYVLAEEVHARPPLPLETPARASYIAVLVDADARERERAHIAGLCERFGQSGPPTGATHFSARLGALRLKWERHGEFSSYTLFAGAPAAAAGVHARTFADPASGLLPVGWLAQLPGLTLVSSQAVLLESTPEPLDATHLQQEVFEGNAVVGSTLGFGAGQVYTDFKIHDDGGTRFLLLNRTLTARQAGQMLQRLFEIEAYRMMALLALPMARRQSPRILAIEKALAELTDGIARDGRNDEALLNELTRLAAEVESGLAASQFRFGACRAYFELVSTRIRELREERVPSIPTIEEFMARRFTPAVATCNTVSQRLHDLSERVAQASALLSTRVDIAREQQNQALLASMDRRAKLQLRLQQTVEGLSVAAIVYYVAGLVGYVGKGLKSVVPVFNVDLTVAVSVPLVAAAALWAVRRARSRIARDEAAHKDN
jgi:uncharacterized membrane-anchored protein